MPVQAGGEFDYVPIDSLSMFNALTSLAAGSGQFDRVMGHEPKAAPDTSGGLTCGVWYMGTVPIQSSGLSAASVRVEFMMRIFSGTFVDPMDSIDPRMMDAGDAMFSLIIGQFQLGLNDARCVDVLGSAGESLRATAGYITQDKKIFRTIDIMIPVLINDAHLESA